MSPLAGVERFERVRINLTNSKQALTKLREHRQDAVHAAIERRQRWTAKLDRLALLRTLAGTLADLLGPHDILMRLTELDSHLGLQADIGPLPSDNDVGRVGAMIRSFRLAVDSARGEADSRLRLLARYRAIPMQWTTLRSQGDAAERRALAKEEEESTLKREAELLTTATNAAIASHARAQRQRDLAAARHRLLSGALRDRDDLPQAERELTATEEQLLDADRKIEAATLEMRTSREDLAAYEGLLTAHARARQQLDESERAANALKEIRTLQARAEVETARADELMTELRDLEITIAANTAEGQLRADAIANYHRELDALRSAATEVQSALAVLATHMRSEHTECPVCHTNFEPGRLLGLAMDSAQRLDPGLTAAEARIAAMTREQESLRARQSRLLQDRRRLQADLKAVQESLAQLRARIEHLRNNALLASLVLEHAEAMLTATRAEQESGLRRIEEALAAKRPIDQLRSILRDREANVDALQRERVLVHERRNTRLAKVGELRARLTQLQREHVELQGSTESVRKLVDEAALEVAGATEAVNTTSIAATEAQAREAALRQRFAVAEDEKLSAMAERASVRQALERLRDQWMEAGLPGQIADSALNVEVERSMTRLRQLDEATAAVGSLSTSLEQWQRAADLHALEEEVRRESGSQGRDAYGSWLDAAVEDARRAYKHAERARSAADELSEKLGRVTSDFSERALRPFDDLFRRYLRALVHDERFHGIEAMYEPAARTAGLRFKVGLGGDDTDAEYILSEGQLGEVSLAAMLAASAAFPWSRWRALLLDDPTQYNDLIHVTALFDVLRNLVRFADYQVLISTHDGEQAAFLRRKLDTLGIPWVDCQYVAHGPDGIIADVKVKDEGPVRS